MDQETLHQTIYKHVHKRLRPYMETEAIAQAVWLGTEDAAMALVMAERGEWHARYTDLQRTIAEAEKK